MKRVLLFLSLLLILFRCPSPWSHWGMLGVSEYDFDIDKDGNSKVVYTFVLKEEGNNSLKLAVLAKDKKEFFTLRDNIDCINPKIRVDNNGYAHIFCYNYREGHIIYFKETTDGFVENVIGSGDYSSDFQMEIDQQNRIHVVTRDSYSLYAYIYDNGETFVSEKIDLKNIINNCGYTNCSILYFRLDRAGNPSFLVYVSQFSLTLLNPDSIYFVFRSDGNLVGELIQVLPNRNLYNEKGSFIAQEKGYYFLGFEYNPSNGNPSVFMKEVTHNDKNEIIKEEYKFLTKEGSSWVSDDLNSYLSLSQNNLVSHGFAYLSSGIRVIWENFSNNNLNLIYFDDTVNKMEFVTPSPLCGEYIKISPNNTVGCDGVSQRSVPKSCSARDNEFRELYYGYYDGEWHVEPVETY